MTRVLIAGAGVAAVECELALRELAGSRVDLELLAPTAELLHRPSSVTTPFSGAPAARIDLAQVAAELGIRLRRDSLASVEPEAHHQHQHRRSDGPRFVARANAGRDGSNDANCSGSRNSRGVLAKQWTPTALDFISC